MSPVDSDDGETTEAHPAPPTFLTSKATSHEAFATIPLNLNELHHKLVEETKGRYIDSMPTQELFDEFMP